MDGKFSNVCLFYFVKRNPPQSGNNHGTSRCHIPVSSALWLTDLTINGSHFPALKASTSSCGRLLSLIYISRLIEEKEKPPSERAVQAKSCLTRLQRRAPVRMANLRVMALCQVHGNQCFPARRMLAGEALCVILHRRESIERLSWLIWFVASLTSDSSRWFAVNMDRWLSRS